ncbi:MAG TPA: SusC/RagA family TonB-linked outer membrane protein [Puia sp.]
MTPTQFPGLVGKLFLLLLISITGLAQDKTPGLSGIVVSETGEPLSGVSVFIRNTAGKEEHSTMSNEKGVFQFSNLRLNTKYNLNFSYVGYRDTAVSLFELKTGEENSLMVRMNKSVSSLNEIVVTALGISSEKKKLGYSVQQLKSEDFSKAQESNPLGALVGKVAGLNIYNSHELLVAPSYNIRGNTPLVVVNGIPLVTDWYNINPEDIESIDVLKGTSASALYGSRGKDGAIMVTTKRGSGSKSKFDVEFKTTNMLQAGFLKIPKQQTHYGTGDHGIYTYTSSIFDTNNDDAGGGAGSWGPKLNAGLNQVQWDSPVDPVTGARTPTPWVARGTNNLHNYIRPSFVTTDNLSLSRNFDNGSIRVSLGQSYQKGQVPESQLNITDFSVAGTFNLTPKLKTDFSLNYSRAYTNNFPFGGQAANDFRKNLIYTIIIWEGVDTDIRDFKNYWKPGQVGLQQNWYNQIEYNNPWFIAHEYVRSLKKSTAFGNYSLSYDIAPGLNVTARAGVNNIDRFQDLKVPKSFREYSNNPYSFGVNGGYQTENENTFDINADLLLTYNHRFGGNFSLNALAGANIRYFSDREQGLKADGLSVPGVYNFTNATSALIIPTANINQEPANVNFNRHEQVNSWYAAYTAGYKNWLFWNVTGRVDRSSTLPVANNTYFYPSTSLGLVLSDVVKLPEVVSFAKLRASVAQVATDLGIYVIDQTYVPGQTWNGSTTVVQPTTLTNANIKPQRTTTQEYGADLRFFRNRLNMDFTYFRSLDENTIINLPVSAAAGYTTRLENANKYLRSGGEISASGNIIRKKNFSWFALVNWSTYKKTIKELDATLHGNYNGLKVGESVNKILSSGYLHTPDGSLAIASNGLPINDPSLQAFGDSTPLWTAGITNRFTYKHFSLQIDIDGRYGGTIFNLTRSKTINAGTNPVTDDAYHRDMYNQGKNSIVVPGEQVVTSNGQASYTRNATMVNWQQYWSVIGGNPYMWKDASFVKLREVSLTYTYVPKTPTAFFKAANVSLVGRNLLLFSHLDGADPDPGVDNLQTPATRTLGLNIDVKF